MLQRPFERGEFFQTDRVITGSRQLSPRRVPGIRRKPFVCLMLVVGEMHSQYSLALGRSDAGGEDVRLSFSKQPGIYLYMNKSFFTTFFQFLIYIQAVLML